MARRSSKTEAAQHTERAWRHPRDTFEVFGHTSSLNALERDIAASSLHHGLLITGDQGTGRATLAYALARRLLNGQGDPDDPETRTNRQISAGAHPDLLVLDAEESETVTRLIPVDRVRDLVRFFTRTSAAGEAEAYRVGMIDTADDLNIASANALLKVLEEPPQRCVLMLICQTPGRLPPTIRSRCRVVALDPLMPEDLASAVKGVGGHMSDEDNPALQRWIGGSVGRALMASDQQIAATINASHNLLKALPRVDQASLDRLALRLGGREQRASFDVAFDVMAQFIADAARHSAAGQGLTGDAFAWAGALSHIETLKREADVLNLDRSRTVIAAFHQLALELAPQH